jgi:hypothetical protein
MKRHLTMLCLALSLLAPTVMAIDAQPVQAQPVLTPPTITPDAAVMKLDEFKSQLAQRRARAKASSAGLYGS